MVIDKSTYDYAHLMNDKSLNEKEKQRLKHLKFCQPQICLVFPRTLGRQVKPEGQPQITSLMRKNSLFTLIFSLRLKIAQYNIIFIIRHQFYGFINVKKKQNIRKITNRYCCVIIILYTDYLTVQCQNGLELHFANLAKW